MRLASWRVRVIRRVEDTVDVLATSAVQAEIEAAKLPFVISVVPKSALQDDIEPERNLGVEE